MYIPFSLSLARTRTQTHTHKRARAQAAQLGQKSCRCLKWGRTAPPFSCNFNQNFTRLKAKRALIQGCASRCCCGEPRRPFSAIGSARKHAYEGYLIFFFWFLGFLCFFFFFGGHKRRLFSSAGRMCERQNSMANKRNAIKGTQNKQGLARSEEEAKGLGTRGSHTGAALACCGRCVRACACVCRTLFTARLTRRQGGRRLCT